jgi:hypothetical protein
MFSSIWDFLAPFVKIFISSAGQILAASALQAVRTVATYAIDNDETKRAKAFSMIVSDLKSKGLGIGIEITTSMINAAIEAAVQKMKAGGE